MIQIYGRERLWDKSRMVQVSGLIVSFSLADLCLILYSESMEWLYWKETQMRESKPGFNIDHYFRPQAKQ